MNSKSLPLTLLATAALTLGSITAAPVALADGGHGRDRGISVSRYWDGGDYDRRDGQRGLHKRYQSEPRHHWRNRHDNGHHYGQYKPYYQPYYVRDPLGGLGLTLRNFLYD